jgi:hypothetical protein
VPFEEEHEICNTCSLFMTIPTMNILMKREVVGRILAGWKFGRSGIERS